jgi:protein required for attachment to host cells
MHRIAIVVADAARARIFTYEPGTLDEPDGESPLCERIDLVDPERRLRPSQVGSPVDDHRDAHEREVDRRFASKIAQQLDGVIAKHPTRDVVIVASPNMLGFLRADMATVPRRGLEVHELALDLTRETPAQLRDRLAAHGLVPARRRNQA